MLGYAFTKVAEVGFRSIRLGRTHVADDLAPIKGHPIECCVREFVNIVPAQLLGEEALHTRLPAQLRELRGVSEGVWKPERLASLPEVGLKKALSV